MSGLFNGEKNGIPRVVFTLFVKICLAAIVARKPDKCFMQYFYRAIIDIANSIFG